MIAIKKSTPADVGLIAGIGAKTLVESHGHSAPAADMESYVSRKFSTEAIEEELNNPENIFHVIFYKNQAVGYSKIIFNCPHPLIETAAVAKLERLYILREFYDFKLGKALFEFNVELSQASNQARIWLFVWTENHRAIRFYQKAGFEIIGSAEFKISETHSNPNHVMCLKYPSK